MSLYAIHTINWILYDVYDAVGQFVACVKKTFQDEYGFLEKKYMDANTFSRTFKLGDCLHVLTRMSQCSIGFLYLKCLL